MTDKEKDLILSDMSMMLRMMITKYRRGKLDDEYCQRVLNYLQRKDLQGNIIRALDTEVGKENQ